MSFVFWPDEHRPIVFVSFLIDRCVAIICCQSHLEIGINMSFESVLEQQRRYHEERERLMDTMTKEMLRKKATVS